jgi:hypothetical protein
MDSYNTIVMHTNLVTEEPTRRGSVFKEEKKSEKQSVYSNYKNTIPVRPML